MTKPSGDSNRATVCPPRFASSLGQQREAAIGEFGRRRADRIHVGDVEFDAGLGDRMLGGPSWGAEQDRDA